MQNKTNKLLTMLQKPVEIFAGIMPINRNLYTKRLYLRRLKRLDALDMLKLMDANKDFLCRWLQPQPEVLRLEHIISLIKDDHKQAKLGNRLDLALISQETDKIVGKIALHSVDYGIQRSAYVSYWIDRLEQGKGYMTEALATIVSFGFEEASLHRINLKISCDNAASSKLANKLGFIQEGIERKSLFINKNWQNALLFSLLEDEYDILADKWINNGWLGF